MLLRKAQAVFCCKWPTQKTGKITGCLSHSGRVEGAEFANGFVCW